MSSSSTETLFDVTMPQMGVSVSEGTVVAWRVDIGDRVEADATVCEISTDKIDTDVPAPVTGVVAEILVPIETTVSVGTVLARIAGAGGGAPRADADARVSDLVTSNGAPDSGALSETVAPSAAPPAAEGDAAAAPAPEGASAPDPGTSRPASAPAPSGAASASATSREATAAATSGEATAAATPGPRRYSPVVQRIAADHGIDLSQVPGTGRGGRVRKQDVMAAIEAASQAEAPLHIESPYRPDPAPAPMPAPTTPGASAAAASLRAPAAPAGTRPPASRPAPAGGQLSRMRRQIGEHMKRSLETAAHCTTWIEVDMSRVEAARGRLGVTALAFVTRACVDALREHPALNAWLEGEQYTRHADVNLGIAVSLGEDGLIVPVVHKAQELSVEGLAVRVRDLARRARGRQLSPDEVRGGTFTITNPGQYGSIMATPIINQPQVAILDFEAVVKRPVVLTDADGNDSIAIRPMTILGLSWDHRALDGAQAAQFLASLKRHLEGLSP